MSVKSAWCSIAFLVLCFSFLCPVCVQSSQEIVRVVEAEGVSIVYGNDEVAAREEAIRDSMRKAVEQVVEMLISEEVASKNIDILGVTIYTKHQDYIRDYQILQEDIEDGRYRIRMRATLSLLDMRRDLELLGILQEGGEISTDTRTVVHVTVRGIERCGDFKILRETLETDIPGIHTVSLRRIGLGVADLDVEVQGNSSLLAKGLQLKEFGNFSLYLIQMTDDTLELNME